MSQTDAHLVERCIEGEREAYAELVRRHQQSVFNLAMQMTQSYQDAADATQDAFIRAYTKLSSYDARFAFRNWVMTICANLIKNRFRSIFRRRKAEEGFLEQQFAEAYPSDPRHRALSEALRELPESTRAPVVLRHVEGFSYEEIAGVLSIGVSAAKMRVSRGLEQLADHMKSSGGVR